MPVNYFTPPIVSARVAAGLNAAHGAIGGFASGSGAKPADGGGSTGAIVVVSLAGVSLLAFGAWLLSQPAATPRRARR